MRDKGFIWNPSNCQCECDKSCDILLDYKTCKCRIRILDKLIEECRENIYENETFDVISFNAIPLNAIPLNEQG